MSDADPGTTSARVVVLSRAGCHLCADACAVVARVAADLGVEWREQDIDGEVHTWFRVDETRLRAVLG